ncbi:ABC transporter [Spirochaetia bacterium]|nr:ABC transporter [Spirochaetia bacterium]
MVVCENLTKVFNGNVGIHDINLEFSPGIIYGIIGFNGSGKTTLLRCIEGLYVPGSGQVIHNGVKTTAEKEFQSYRQRIAFLPTDDFLYKNLTCMENIELATILRTGKNKLLKETHDLIRYFEADNFLHKNFRDCSTGMKKKIQIIISLIGDIDTIVWDEPNDGLDIVSNIKIKNLLNYYKSKNVTIIFSSHVIEFLDNFIDHCVLLKDGAIIEKKETGGKGSLEALYMKYIDKEIVDVPFF